MERAISMATESEELRLSVIVDDEASAKLVGGEESSAEPVFEAIEAQRHSL
jgi:hypothetical protein